MFQAWMYDQAAWRHNRLHLVLVFIFLAAACAMPSTHGLVTGLIALATLVIRVAWWQRRGVSPHTS